MNYHDYAIALLPSLEETLKKTLSSGIGTDYPELAYMLSYHMGWEGPGSGPKAHGKRIRPLLLLLSAIATGDKWQDFLHLAAAVELIHNFSLIHDDIEDNSPLRRGRETLWVRWGIPQATNAGDLMFTIAHQAILEKNSRFGDKATLEAAWLLHQTCIQLTQGQYLDMDFEKRSDVTTADYLRMIQGKTAALLGCCTELGAINKDSAIRSAMANFGLSLGLAFQIQDDILGLWGDISNTGKSTDSDLVSGKKTFPILYAIQNNQQIRQLWMAGSISPTDAKDIALQLKSDGTYSYTKFIVQQYTTNALHHLDSTNLDNDGITSLRQVATELETRNK